MKTCTSFSAYRENISLNIYWSEKHFNKSCGKNETHISYLNELFPYYSFRDT
jgi:hypothetical protein